MFYYCAIIITAFTFYKILNLKIFYKIILSIVLGIFLTVFIIILNNVAFNAYCTLTDHIGYNSITKFIRFCLHFSDWVILIIIQILLLYYFYKKNK